MTAKHVLSIHCRDIGATPDAVSDVLATTGQRRCLVSPTGWPPDMRIRLDAPVVPGAAGGHGMVRYSVESVERGHHLTFRMAPEDALDGFHRFELDALGDGRGTHLVHRLEGSMRGMARASWPIIRRFHDAYIEAVFDRIEEASTGGVRLPSRLPLWMRVWNRLDTARQQWTPPRRIAGAAGVVVPAVLTGVGALHLQWAGGGHWPASSRRSLAEAVIGWTTMPPNWASGVVGIGLIGGAAALASSATGRRGWSTTIAATTAAALIARGTAFWPLDGLGEPGRYRTLSLALYTPLSLVLGVGAATIVRAATVRRTAVAGGAEAGERDSELELVA